MRAQVRHGWRAWQRGLVIVALCTSCGGRDSSTHAPSPAPSARSAPLEAPTPRVTPLPEPKVIALPEPDAGPATKAVTCGEIERCLARALPTTYDPSRQNESLRLAYACLGESPEAAWNARPCLPYRFGRDSVSGRAVQVSVYCSDVCPDYTRVSIGFAEELGPRECLCLGGQARHEAGFGGYVGCGPAAPHDTQDFLIRKYGEHQLVFGGVLGSRAMALGISQGSLITAIDGKRVTSVEQLDRMLGALPNTQPASLTFGDPRGASTKTRSLHFVTHEALARIARVAEEVNFGAITARETRCGRSGVHGMVRVGERWVPYDSACDNDATTRLRRLTDAIRQAAARARRRTAVSPSAPERCKELRDFPVEASFSNEQDAIEVRYVDWLVRRR